MPRSLELPAAAALVAWLLLPDATAAAEWSRFRGPNGSGIVVATRLPTTFGPDEAVDWVARVPFGRSSPILTDRHVFLTAIEEGELLTVALDRESGREAWRRAVPRDYEAVLHQATDSATPTPVTDGENVYAFFHEAGLVSYDPAGKERWRVALAPFRNFYSVAASPILVGEVLVLLCDQARGSSFLLGLDKDTGEQLWRSERPSRAEAYSTPVLWPSEEEPSAILVLGSKWLDAYDPRSGEILWAFPGVGAAPVASPVLAGDTLYVSAPDQASGQPEPFESLLRQYDGDGDQRLTRGELEGFWIANHFGWVDGDGDGWISSADWDALLTEMSSDHWGVYALRLPAPGGPPEPVWNTRQSVSYIPTPLAHEGVLYYVKGNVLSVADLATGEILGRSRLGSGADKVYSSPVAADGKVYIGLVGGEMAVLEAGREGKVLATNDLGDEIYATPAIADGELYVRTRSLLFRFHGVAPEPGSPSPAASTSAPQ